MSGDLNLKAGGFAFLFLGIALAGMVALLARAPVAIAFSVVLVGFIVFSTVALMNAKTTGGPIG